MKPKDNMHLYYIGCQSLGVVKIGRAVDPNGRLRSLLHGSPTTDLNMLFVAWDRGADEYAVHYLWRNKHHHGEWFVLDEELRSWIESGAELPDGFVPGKFNCRKKLMKRKAVSIFY